MVDYLSLCDGPDEGNGSLDLYGTVWADERGGVWVGRTWKLWHVTMLLLLVPGGVRADSR